MAAGNQSPWIRSFGTASEDPKAVDLEWRDPVGRSISDIASVGACALHMTAQFVTDHEVPVALLDGAVGGTAISEHKRNHADPARHLEDLTAHRADWEEDFAAVEHVYVFQVRDGCGVDLRRDAALEVTLEDADGTMVDWQSMELVAGAD